MGNTLILHAKNYFELGVKTLPSLLVEHHVMCPVFKWAVLLFSTMQAQDFVMGLDSG